MSGRHHDRAISSKYRAVAANIRAGVLDLLWDPSKLAFYDFNLTSNSRNSILSAATFYPMRLASSRVSTWLSDAIMVHTHRRLLNRVSNGMLRTHGRRINISRWRPCARSLPTYQSGRSLSRKQGNLPLHLCQADSLGWRRTLYPDK